MGAEFDHYQVAALTWDDEGLPVWGQPGCVSCHGYGWQKETTDVTGDIQATSINGCDCCDPESDDGVDRLQERLLFVASLLAKSESGAYSLLTHDMQ
jgi:hypothetical protein